MPLAKKKKHAFAGCFRNHSSYSTVNDFFRYIEKQFLGKTHSGNSLTDQKMLGSIVSIVSQSKFNSFITEAEDWFLYDNGLRHERVKEFSYKLIENYC